MGSEGHQDIDLAILTALLKGGRVHICVCVYLSNSTVSDLHFIVTLQGCLWKDDIVPLTVPFYVHCTKICVYFCSS